MPFKKGASGNVAGKPKGAKNKSTDELRKWVTGFVETNKSQIQKDWEELKPVERITLFEKLLKYVLPTLQATSVDFTLERLTDEQLSELTNDLISSD